MREARYVRVLGEPIHDGPTATTVTPGVTRYVDGITNVTEAVTRVTEIGRHQCSVCGVWHIQPSANAERQKAYRERKRGRG